MTLHVADGTLEVPRNTTGFEVVHGPPPRDLPTLDDLARARASSR
jgi:hypothetical protein